MPPPRRKSGAAIASTIFVDREEPKRTFEKAVFSIPAKGCLLRVWFGVGGQGKTALARELFQISDAKFEPSYGHLRRAMLDLHGRPINDPDRLLVWIRNAFSGAGVSFPAFDLAFAIMWQKTRGEEPLPNFHNPWLYRTGQAVSATVPDAISLTRGLVEELSGTIPGLGFLINQGTKWVFNKGKRAWLEKTRPQLETFYRNGRLIEDHEMSALMPWMLAQDLNQHLAEHPDERFVLFVDEYERVMEGAGTGARWRENTFDAHMRSFVAETDGLLAIFFSRESLPWEDDPDWRDTLLGHQHLLGGLSEQDAEKWLLAVPIEDAAIRSAIIDGAGETSEPAAPIYPLMLDLQVEHWRNLGDKAAPDSFSVAATGFEARRRELVERLLRDYEDPVQDALARLALTGRFDREAFECIVKSCNIPLAFGAFDKLASLSIVATDDEGWLSLHRAIADAIVQSLDQAFLAQTRSLLRAHFEGRAKPVRPVDVTDTTTACFVEAASLRLQDGHDGYVDWLKAATEILQLASRSAFLERVWREALDLSLEAFGSAHPDTGTSLTNLAINLGAQGREQEAEPLFRQALEIRLAAFGEGDARTGESYDALGINQNALGRYAEADRLNRKGLDIRRAALGEDHPDTGSSYNNVASNLEDQGKHKEAQPLYRKGLEIRRSALGKIDPDTSASYNNIALNLHYQGQFEEADTFYRKSLEISLAVYGENHPETAFKYNNLASNLHSMGQWDEAEPLYKKALEIVLTTLGEGHPETGTAYNNLASLYSSQGRYDKAEELYRKSLAIRRLALGDNHPDAATSFNNIAYMLMKKGDHEEATVLYQRGLEICRNVLGEDHPVTGRTCNNIAASLSAMGRHTEAEPLYIRCLEIRRAAFGEAHPDTAASYGNVASNLDDQERHEEAEPLYRKSLEIRLAILGEAHPDTATSYNNLASNLDDQERWEEARPLYQKCLQVRRAALGEDHPDTGNAYNNLGFNLEMAGSDEEAETYYRKSLKINRRALGPSHPDTGLSYLNLAANCFAQGRYEEAKSLYEKAISALSILGDDHLHFQMALNGLEMCKAEMQP